MPTAHDERRAAADEHWRQLLTEGSTDLENRGRRLLARLPKGPRCKACNAPFDGMGAPLVRVLLGKWQSTIDPRYCNQCTDHMRQYPGGAEIDVSMLFADVRGSTSLAENRSPTEFREFINRFYHVASDVLLGEDAIIDRLIGDEVVGIFVPGMAGPDHARRAIQAGRAILQATGHDSQDGPWIPVGGGVHTGVSYVGTVGSKGGAIDLTALGDVPNVAARLASEAAAGELIVSTDACQAAGLDPLKRDIQEMSLKGREGTIEAASFRLGSTSS
jgi:adenylate cyclase